MCIEEMWMYLLSQLLSQERISKTFKPAPPPRPSPLFDRVIIIELEHLSGYVLLSLIQFVCLTIANI